MTDKQNTIEELKEAQQKQEENISHLTGIYGDIEETEIGELVGELFSLYALENPPPVKFIVSTAGGMLIDAFALYDILRLLREKTEVETWAVGKVMSAGLMIVSAGTKGKRHASANTRFMLHSASVDYSGTINEVYENLKELEHSQQTYLSILAKETKMTKKQLEKMLSTNLDYHFNAEEAKNKGFIDVVV